MRCACGEEQSKINRQPANELQTGRQNNTTGVVTCVSDVGSLLQAGGQNNLRRLRLLQRAAH